MIRKSSFYHMLQIGLVLLQFLPGTLSTAEAAKLVYENTFTNGWGDAYFVSDGYGPSVPASCKFDTKFRFESDPAGSGSQVAMITQPGDSCLTGNPELKHRAMIAPKPNGNRYFIPHDTEVWVGYRVYVPSSYPDNCERSIHFSPRTSKDFNVPESFLECTGSGVVMSVQQIYTVAPNTHVRGAQKADEYVKLDLDAWNDIVMRVKWTDTNAGYFELYKNGVRVVNWQNIRTASSPSMYTQNGSVKDIGINMGLYWGKTDRPGTYRIYYDDIRIATGALGFDLVSPSSSDTRMAAPAPPVLLSGS